MIIARTGLSSRSSLLLRLSTTTPRYLSTHSQRPLVNYKPSKLPLATLGGIRLAASQVSNRPGSQSIPHAVQNIREEAGHAIEDVAQKIAAAPQPFGSTAQDSPLNSGFVGITSAIASAVPTPVMVFGLAGSLPYLGTSIYSVYLANQAGQAASGIASKIDPGLAMSLLDQAMNVQVTYGAVMLGFLGAIHWGLEFAQFNGSKGAPRLLLGIAPTIVGWATLGLDPGLALVAQWAGFTGLWLADMRATAAGWTPVWYSQYRFYLSILVGTCIIGTLAGTSYFGPTQSHSATLRELHALRQARERRVKEEMNKPVAPGEVGGVSGEETNADVFVLIKHAPEPTEKDKKKNDQ
ncbi:SubName: Full=Probable MNN4-regulates the mannosylphosphorylation {ECO:0000313/EMBL:CCA66657.1} [Serendipita indica DSM 11827]|uniref:Probable MNN4-regulates the mannosylphosphorylation n=1 Tax=Serendipita indica (strain DSM 11827) TaxID=1109443 RepID=G4T5S0_SERID|nr:SubName: Full=Probable MNN4-regulates the mannosylphosphorylation {ECO:0000313/EMBL:CCA66657.1} [Serendipita indica DSM 11827]CCA66657.1 probable MNN4-regulates the mannosylphosphorylation [Serendipita indica DSM 11827]